MTSFIKKDGAYKGFKEEVWAELSSSEMNNIKYMESKERKATAQHNKKKKHLQPAGPREAWLARVKLSSHKGFHHQARLKPVTSDKKKFQDIFCSQE